MAASPWKHPGSGVRLRGWSDAQLQAVVQVLDRVCDDWARDWGLPSTTVRAARAVDEPESEPWIRFGGSADPATVWFQAGIAARSAAEVRCFGAVPTPVTDDLVDLCRADLRSRILGALGVRAARGDECALPREVVARWSGALSLSVGDGPRLVADAQAVLHVISAAGSTHVAGDRLAASPLCAVKDALAETQVAFDLAFADCEFPAAALLNLAAGDVVCLSHPLDAPVHLRDAEGRSCFQGNLRKHARSRAVELRSHSLPPLGNDRRETSHA